MGNPVAEVPEVLAGKKVVSRQEKAKPHREPQISRFGFTP